MNFTFSTSSNTVSGPFISGGGRTEEGLGMGPGRTAILASPHPSAVSARKARIYPITYHFHLGRLIHPSSRPPVLQLPPCVSLALLLEQREDRNKQASSDFCPLKPRPKCSLFWADGAVPTQKDRKISRETVAEELTNDNLDVSNKSDGTC